MARVLARFELFKSLELIPSILFFPDFSFASKALDEGPSGYLVHRADDKLQPEVSRVPKWVKKFYKAYGYD